MNRQVVRIECMMITAALALALAAGSAVGQTWAGQDGRLTDANPQLGGSRINALRPAPTYDTNLIVTGNITGGRAFQGFSPIRDSSSFFIDLPSASLSNFRRDSASISNVGTGSASVFTPRPFYDPSLTITSTGEIIQGLNVPGTSIPANPYSSLQQDYTRVTPPRLTMPAYPSIEDTRLPASAEQAQAEAWAEAAGTTLSPSMNLPRGQVNQWLAQSTLFAGNPNLRAMQLLSTDPVEALRQLRAERPVLEDGRVDTFLDPRLESAISPEGEEASAEQIEPRPEESMLYRALRSELPGVTALAMNPEALALLEETPAELPAGLRVGEPGSFVMREPRPPSAGPVVAEEEETPQPYREPLDATDAAQRYSELYLQEYRQRFRSRAVDESGGGAGAATPREMSPTAEGQGGGLLNRELPGDWAVPGEQAGPAPARMQRQLAELLGRTVTTMVTSAETPVNLKVKRAEKLMHQQQYFAAAGQYQIAEVFDPENPLPSLGRAHALLAAGDYLTAMSCLKRGIGNFAGFENFRLDLKSFSTDAQLLDIRRASLEQRLAEKEDHELRFLLGYVECHMGLEQYGRPNLELAAEQAPPGSLIARFPQMLDQRVDLDAAPQQPPNEAAPLPWPE